MSYTNNHDTIAAMATSPGENSVSIIRLSGLKAISIANEMFSGSVTSYESHTVHLGYALTIDKKKIDQCLLIVMKAPRSYTGEDVVEIHCHGGFFAPTSILDTLYTLGARPALQGEFTFRAFINGKMDLIQAEAVQKIISARNETAFSIAQRELSGKLSEKINRIKNHLISSLALIEAYLDFPEDLDSIDLSQQLNPFINQASEEVNSLLASYDEGRRILSGTEIAIVGDPNVGKSSLLNALTDKDAAIVSEIPGTTRDFVKEEFVLYGKLFKLIDTAGLRDTDHPIEKEGIRRTENLLLNVSLNLWVIDNTAHSKAPPKNIFPHNTILIINKIDLKSLQCTDFWLGEKAYVSTKTGQGIGELKKIIYKYLENSENSKEDVFLITQRQFNNLMNIQRTLNEIRKDIEHPFFPECLAADLREAIEETGLLSGFSLNEDVLNEVFGQFCIGK
ncbi:MAG: tRNA uridine-5-carboxymethylaminomethyl(34) synthesis GTPase MnmE [Victivallaceae bacterium]